MLSPDTKKVIFVVDGNVDRQARTQKTLVTAGYTVLSASSAEEAEAVCNTDAVFDLVICAVVMDGGHTGIHLAEHIERSRRINSTLLISHYHRDLLHMVPGFDRQPEFLSNPFTAKELLARVNRLL
jgi:DNA-binding response OmpR family regulator